jgi:hypothetical protein
VSSFHEWHDVLDNVAKLEVEPSDFYGTGRGVESRFGLIFLPFRWTAADAQQPSPEEGGRPAGGQDRNGGQAAFPLGPLSPTPHAGGSNGCLEQVARG